MNSNRMRSREAGASHFDNAQYPRTEGCCEVAGKRLLLGQFWDSPLVTLRDIK